MSFHKLSDRCPHCNAIVDYNKEDQAIRCLQCGHEFLAVEFLSQSKRMEELEAENEEVNKRLAATKEEQRMLQGRLNNTLSSLHIIETSQHISEEQISRILQALQDDHATHAAMKGLLENMQEEEKAGHTGLTSLLQKVMQKQEGTEKKLSAVHQATEKILQAQEKQTLRQQETQIEILSVLGQMQLSFQEQMRLSFSFSQWAQNVQAEEVERLKKIQLSSDELLNGQRQLLQKADRLQKTADETQKKLLEFQEEMRKKDLDKLAETYHGAVKLQHDYEFDKAEEKYRNVLEHGGREAEVYWRILLCHYCVKYQEDAGKIIPIILNPDLTPPEEMSIRKDLQASIQTEAQKKYYLSRLETIDRYLTAYREVRTDEKWQFDVFISVKQSDQGHPTYDKDQGIKLYEFLTKKGLKVFNSERTHLPLGEDYEPYIITALMSAKVLIVVGSSKEYMESQWVKNEWFRFQWMQKREKKAAGKTERLLFCYLVGGMRSGEIPKGLNQYKQALQDDIFAQDKLLETIRSVFPERFEQKSNQRRTEPEAESAVNMVESQLERGYIDLQFGDFEAADKAFENVLNINPKNGKAYLGKLLAELKLHKEEELKNCKTAFQEMANYKKAVYFGDARMKQRLEEWMKEQKLKNPAEVPEQNPTDAQKPPAQTPAKVDEVSYVFPDGAKYYGALKNGLPHGQGKCESPNGDRYEGAWVNGKRTGKGEYFWPNGNRYIGDFVDDKRTGKGEYFWSNGNRYIGDFKDGTLHGKGVKIWADGDRDEGIWKDGCMIGDGIRILKNRKKLKLRNGACISG